MDADGTNETRLADCPAVRMALAWSSDGEKIAFPCPAAPGAAGTDVCVINADGTEWKRIALKVGPEEVPGSVS
jgi:hypothetical protein